MAFTKQITESLVFVRVWKICICSYQTSDMRKILLCQIFTFGITQRVRLGSNTGILNFLEFYHIFNFVQFYICDSISTTLVLLYTESSHSQPQNLSMLYQETGLDSWESYIQFKIISTSWGKCSVSSSLFLSMHCFLYGQNHCFIRR